MIIDTDPAVYPFTGPVRRPDEPEYNPAAHGGCSFVDYRRAEGKIRRRNVNGRHVEVGAWKDSL